MNKTNNDLPGRVSWRVVDAWLAIPPCNYEKPYCHIQCPYFYECYPPEESDEDEYILDELNNKQSDEYTVE